MFRALIPSAVLAAILAPASLANPMGYYDTISLDASQVVPPTDSHGSATLYVQINDLSGWSPVEGYYDACYHDLEDSVTSVTICEGSPGINGPVLHTAYSGESECSDESDLTGWTMDELNEAEAGNLYALISTRAHPDGELRGQTHMQEYPVRYITWGSVKTTFR